MSKGGTYVKKRSKGFSLLEVALVLLIMGIIGVAAIPSMQNIRRQEVNKLAKEICLDLVTQMTNQNTNRDETYVLDLVKKDASPTSPYYGYVITTCDSSLNPKPGIKSTERIQHNKNIEIVIKDTSGNIPATPITKLRFLDKKITDAAGNEYKNTLQISLKNDQSKLEIVFYTTTGHYEISVP